VEEIAPAVTPTEEIVQPVAPVPQIAEPAAQVPTIAQPVATAQETAPPVTPVQAIAAPVAEVPPPAAPVEQVHPTAAQVQEIVHSVAPVPDVEAPPPPIAQAHPTAAQVEAIAHAVAPVAHAIAPAPSDSVQIDAIADDEQVDQPQTARLEVDEPQDSQEVVEPRVVARPKQKVTVIGMGRRRTLDVAAAELTDWIKEAMERGATALYLRSGKAPSARIDGRVETLAADPLPMAMFERAGAAMTAGEDGWRNAGEWAWSREIAGTSPVLCQAFSDGQGGGFIVQLPVSVAGLEQQVPRHIRAACESGEGLVVISAPFAEDVAAMVGAVVAWNAQRRAGFVVAFGAGGGLQSVAGEAFISERPMPTSHTEMAQALQNALRERPDTLVFTASESLPAVDGIVWASVGRLVVVGVVARTAARAVELLVKDASNRRALAAAFRGACSWRGFRRPGGQRLVVSDVLISNEHVVALIEAGDIAGLHATQKNREDGMRALDSALAAAVTRRKITLREAAACAVDRKVLIALVRRQAREARATEREEQRASHRASVLRAKTGF
jgi:twitching motility protein PilU